MRIIPVVLCILLSTSGLLSQDSATEAKLESPPAKDPHAIVVPAGTKVPLVLKHALTTKSARVGDGVYLQTSFPVTVDNNIIIPPGTYVQGVIDQIKRPGRIKGRAQVLFHFTTLIFPNGYTLSIPGSIESVPGMETSTVKDKEGTVQSSGQKGEDAATVGGAAATGGLIGGLSHGAKGLGIGSGIGAAAGLATVLLTRGNDVRLEAGTTVEMVFNRALQLDRARLYGSAAQSAEAQQQPAAAKRPVLVPAPE
ncbi:MAG: TrbI/VirB10 family protein [Acidobacteriales bacterium]|nr:TrbI/VirB10 family protein [Terriglobales bacterium]